VSGRTQFWSVVGLMAGAMLLAAMTLAQPAAKKNLSYEQVFVFRPPARGGGGPPAGDLLRQLPSVGAWLDGGHYTETRRDDANGERKLYSVSADDGTATVLIDYKALGKSLPEGFDLRGAAAQLPDSSAFILAKDGDLYYFRRSDALLKRLTATPAEEQTPRFSPNGAWVAYTRDHNLFAYDLTNGVEHQYTRDGSDAILNGYCSWVYYEEILGRGSQYAAFWWSPDSLKLAFARFDDSPVPAFPIYHADGQHGEIEKQRYPKAGDPNPYVQVGVVSVADGALAWMDFDPKADHYLAFPFWNHDSSALIVQWMNRGQDTLHFYACDPKTGKKKLLYEEKQPAWVEFVEEPYVFKDGSGFLITSNKDGWDHIYSLKPDGSPRVRLTSGAWRVNAIAGVDEKNGWVYFTGRPKKSWDAQLLRVKLDGTGQQILTPAEGTHRASLSTDCSYFIDNYSTVIEPNVMALHRADGTLIRQLGAARSPAMDEYAWGKAELFTIPSGDSFDLPASWVLPVGFDPAREYPVIISIYGGPDSAMVANSWAGLQSHYWAQRGVITMRVDHRGSGHFGKKATALMHRNLGKWEMADYGAAATWLRTKSFVAKDRIGIAGGSYGGYVTLMALTHGAELFNYGQASSSVSAWELYDSVYTERYMDTPAENPEGYKNGAVLTWADRYKGGLKITHGTIDDNVHMQNSIQVIDWLTSHNKLFELMLYPDSRHGFQMSQRAHSTREAHDFWVRTWLRGQGELAPVVAPPGPPQRPGPPPR
jgi:dipeptidyl-peptidase-4